MNLLNKDEENEESENFYIDLQKMKIDKVKKRKKKGKWENNITYNVYVENN